MDEILSKHGGVSYYKYSDYKLNHNCAFGSRTEALLDSDDDGFFDGLEIYNGFNPHLPDADKDGRLDYQEYCEDTVMRQSSSNWQLLMEHKQK